MIPGNKLTSDRLTTQTRRSGFSHDTMKLNLSITFIAVLLAVAVDRVLSTSPPPTSPWIGKQAPELAKGDWVNSSPRSLRDLRGKVVLLEFWAFECSNCRNTLPHLKEWYGKYGHSGFEIIGIHTPEFDREKKLDILKREIAHLGITYPVLTDNDYTTWNRYDQQYWPVLYLLDKRGVIRYVHIGEGSYDETDRCIASLLAEK